VATLQKPPVKSETPFRFIFMNSLINLPHFTHSRLCCQVK
jgi:hypothetical protein